MQSIRSRRRRDSTGKRNSCTTLSFVVNHRDIPELKAPCFVGPQSGIDGEYKSMPGAVRPFERLRSRLRPARIYGVNTPSKTFVTSAAASEQWRMPEPTDLIFPKWQRELFKTILDEQNLRFDRDGRPRTTYSLRHIYICLRPMEGADIHQIAKNCRTSVEMIEETRLMIHGVTAPYFDPGNIGIVRLSPGG